MLYFYLRTPYTFKNLWIIFYLLKFHLTNEEYSYEDDTGFIKVHWYGAVAAQAYEKNSTIATLIYILRKSGVLLTLDEFYISADWLEEHN